MIPHSRSCSASASADLDRSHPVKVKVALADLRDPASLPDSRHEPAALNYTVKTPHFSLMRQQKVESAEAPKAKKLRNCPHLKRKSSAARPGGSENPQTMESTAGGEEDACPWVAEPCFLWHRQR